VCCCTDVGAAWGRGCELCPNKDEEEYSLLCPGGLGFAPDVSGGGGGSVIDGGGGGDGVLADVDECVELPRVCGPNGRCTNTFGGFVCACDDGYAVAENGVRNLINRMGFLKIPIYFYYCP